MGNPAKHVSYSMNINHTRMCIYIIIDILYRYGSVLQNGRIFFMWAVEKQNIYSSWRWMLFSHVRPFIHYLVFVSLFNIRITYQTVSNGLEVTALATNPNSIDFPFWWIWAWAKEKSPLMKKESWRRGQKGKRKKKWQALEGAFQTF